MVFLSRAPNRAVLRVICAPIIRSALRRLMWRLLSLHACHNAIASMFQCFHGNFASSCACSSSFKHRIGLETPTGIRGKLPRGIILADHFLRCLRRIQTNIWNAGCSSKPIGTYKTRIAPNEKLVGLMYSITIQIAISSRSPR